MRLFLPRAPCSSLAWLLACRCVARCRLRPRGVGSVLVSVALTAWPAPRKRGSARSQHSYFSGLCVRFRATPFTSPHSLVFLPACAFCHYTTERLTNLTQEGLWVYPLFPLDRQPLPGHPFCLLPSSPCYSLLATRSLLLAIRCIQLAVTFSTKFWKC